MSLLYDFHINDFGNIDIGLRYTRYLTDETTFVGINNTSVTTVPLGEIENSEDEVRLRLGYNKGAFNMYYTMTYESDDINGDPDPGIDRYFEVGGVSYHRIYAAYNFGQDVKYRIYRGC